MKNIILKIHKKNIFRLQFENYITVKLIIVFYIIFVSLSYGEEIFIGQGSRQLIYDQLAIQDAMKKFFGSKNDIVYTGPISSEQFKTEIYNTYDVNILSEKYSEPLIVGYSKRFDLQNFLSTEFSISYNTGNSKYYLPNGLKPFIEPVHIKVNYVSLNLNTLFVYSKYLNSTLSAEIKFGLNQSLGWVKSNIDSDLLEVATNKRHASSNLIFNLSLPIGREFKIKPGIQTLIYNNKKIESQFITNFSYKF